MKISIDGETYEIAEQDGLPAWTTRSTGREISKKYTFKEGIGETVCEHSGDCPRIYMGENIDTSNGTLRANPSITTIGNRYTGTFDDAGGATLTDSAASFPTSGTGLDDYTVTITGGTGSGSASRVTSNTGTALSITPSITTDTDSTYDVSVLGTFAYTPMTFHEDFDTDGDGALYVDYRDCTTTPDIIIVKISESSDLPVDREISAAAAAATAPRLGRVEVFEGASYFPSGDGSGSNVIRKLATVGDVSATTDDTWENAGANTWGYAHAGIMVNGVAKFAKATQNSVALIGSDPITSDGVSGTFEQSTEVGDSTDDVVWIVETTDGLLTFCTIFNLWLFDEDKKAYSILPINRHKAKAWKKTYDEFDGHMSAPVSAGVLYPCRRALYLYENRTVKKVSIDHIEGYRAVQNISNIPFGLRHYAVETFGDNIYSIYKPTGSSNSANVHIMYGQYDRGDVLWRPLLTLDKDIIGLKITSDMKLHFIYDPQAQTDSPGTPSADKKYITLQNDGSPRTDLGSNRGTASTTSICILPEWDGGASDENIQWRKMTIKTENLPASDYVSIQLRAHLDGGAVASVGSPITTSGGGVYTVEWTVGTADTAYDCRPRADITFHASYDSSNSDFRMLWLILTGRTPDTERVIIVKGQQKNMKEIRKALRKLVNADVKTVYEPDTNETHSAQVIAVNDIVHDGKPAVEVLMHRWDVAA